jgi:spermidine synthase
MKNAKLIFSEGNIKFEDGFYVMSDKESSIMLEHAKLVCKSKGDILEIGFGMGISANFIQEIGVNSHTIIEVHPEILKKARDWSKDKSNVTIIEGDWSESLNLLKKYDGIFYDAEEGPLCLNFLKVIDNLIKPGGIFTFWNPGGTPEDQKINGFRCNIENVKFIPMDVTNLYEDKEIFWIKEKIYWIPYKEY